MVRQALPGKELYLTNYKKQVLWGMGTLLTRHKKKPAPELGAGGVSPGGYCA